jgi:glycosyltransferase involved in cell wall biosynthesis
MLISRFIPIWAMIADMKTPIEKVALRPLKICLLSYRSNPHSGGQGVYIRNLSRALRDLGHRVTVVSGPPEPRLDTGIDVCTLSGLNLYDPAHPFRMPTARELLHPLNLLEWLSVSTMGYPEPFVYGLRAYRYLMQRLEFFDVIHDNQCLSYGIWAVSRRTPTVATIHHPITVDRSHAVKNAPPGWQKLKQLRWYSFIGMQARVARALPRLLTVSNCARMDIGRDFGIPSERLTVVPNGVNTDHFHPLPGVAREQGRIIATNSADIPLKGMPYLLKALAQLSQSRSVRLVVIGTLKEKGLIDRLIDSLGIRDQVSFTGRIDSAAYIGEYARASVAVVPSLYEGFGLPAAEAMACAVPVVSTTGGALPEVVGDTGILVPPADSSALADAISRVLDDPVAAVGMGEAGRRRAEKLFNWQRTARMTEDVYRRAIHDYRRF